MHIVQSGPLHWAGITARTKNAKEQHAVTAKIPRLWRTFYADIYGRKVPATTVYGIYYNYESDLEGYYTFAAGVRVEDDFIAARGLVRIDAAASSYTVLQGTGPMPARIHRIWQQAWNIFALERGAPQRAYTVDFEKYARPDVTFLYLSVKS